MVDWSKLPDLGAVALLTCAFGSVARRSRSASGGVWLTGWIMIALHFGAFMFAQAPGIGGTLAVIVGLASLTWAGVLFMWASVPYRNESSSRWMLTALLTTNTVYITLLSLVPNTSWMLVAAAILFGVTPLAVALITMRWFFHTLRWTVIFLYLDLSIFLLAFQRRPGNGAELALNAVLFAVFLGCTIHFWYSYRRPTAGALITISGFFFWSAVFVVAPMLAIAWPSLQVQSEVWNLPKYVAAVGMILLVLEDQIRHNQYLALHDELTGLPNRRLFQDRLIGALERARRTQSRAALLLIDLDNFKTVNDTAGHHVGDLLLQRVGAIFAGRVRRSDTLARTGGDEFALILEEPITREAAEQVGEALVRLLDEPVDLGDQIVFTAASIGIAIFPEDATAGEELCIIADRRMYAEKNSARPTKLPPSRTTSPSVIAGD
ncbi:MAG: GGDEF domain-containing protein [Acidobacteriaceae bacterium]